MAFSSPLRRCLVAIGFVVSFAPAIPAQEFPIVGPPKNIPDHLLYGTFLRHHAAFEQLARQREAQGKSGEFYRSHLMHAYDLTKQEQDLIANIALDHEQRMAPLRAQKMALNKSFREQMFPGNSHLHGTPVPSPTPELLALRQRIVDEELAGRDAVRAAMGEARFQRLDALLRARASHDYRSLSQSGGEPTNEAAP